MILGRESQYTALMQLLNPSHIPHGLIWLHGEPCTGKSLVLDKIFQNQDFMSLGCIMTIVDCNLFKSGKDIPRISIPSIDHSLINFVKAQRAASPAPALPSVSDLAPIPRHFLTQSSLLRTEGTIEALRRVITAAFSAVQPFCPISRICLVMENAQQIAELEPRTLDYLLDAQKTLGGKLSFVCVSRESPARLQIQRVVVLNCIEFPIYSKDEMLNIIYEKLQRKYAAETVPSISAPSSSSVPEDGIIIPQPPRQSCPSRNEVRICVDAFYKESKNLVLVQKECFRFANDMCTWENEKDGAVKKRGDAFSEALMKHGLLQEVVATSSSNPDFSGSGLAGLPWETKFLALAAFLASRNPASFDAKVVLVNEKPESAVESGGLSRMKRDIDRVSKDGTPTASPTKAIIPHTPASAKRRKLSEQKDVGKSASQIGKLQSFALDRLLAIYRALYRMGDKSDSSISGKALPPSDSALFIQIRMLISLNVLREEIGSKSAANMKYRCSLSYQDAMFLSSQTGIGITGLLFSSVAADVS